MLKYKINIYKILIIINLFGIIYGHLGLNEGNRCNTDDKPGICTKLQECQSMIKLLETGKIKYKDIEICSYIRDIPVVCCLDKSPIDNEVVTKRPTTTNTGGLIFPREPKLVSRFENQLIGKINFNKTAESNIKSFNSIHINNFTITDKTEYIDLTNLLNNWPKNQIESSSLSSKTKLKLTNIDKINLNNRTAESRTAELRLANTKLESLIEYNEITNYNASNNNQKNNVYENPDYSDIFKTNGDFLDVNIVKTDNKINSEKLIENKKNIDLNLKNNLARNMDKWVWESKSTIKSTTESPYTDSDKSDPWEPYKFRPAPELVLTDVNISDESSKIVSRQIRNPQGHNWRHQRGGGMRTHMVVVPANENFYPQSNNHGGHWNNGGNWNHGGNWNQPPTGSWNQQTNGGNFYASRDTHFGEQNINWENNVKPNQGDNSVTKLTIVDENLDTASSDNAFRINENNPWLSKITSTTKRPDIIFPSIDNARRTTPKPILDSWMKDALESTASSTTKTTTTTKLDPWIKDALDYVSLSSTTEIDPFLLYEPNFPSKLRPPTTSTLEPWIKDALNAALLSSTTTTTTTTTTQKPRNDYIDLNRIINSLPNNNASPSRISPNANSMQNPSLSGILKPHARSARRQSDDNFNFITQNPGNRNDVTKPTRPSSGPRKSAQACQKYQKLKLPNLDFQILDGLPVEEGEFPHMVALGYPATGFGRDYEWDCGGSLISERYVLTAAHCFIRNEPTVVRMGKRTLDSDEDKQTTVDVPVLNITIHPEYSSFLKYNDIALVRLANDVEFDPTHVLPACLYEKTTDIPQTRELWATGWGVINTNTRSRSSILLKVNLTSYDLNTCNKSHIDFGVNRQYPTGLDNGQLCAGDPEGKKDTCQGDSGGPLQIIEGNNKMSILIGITSFGASCGTTVPSVYSRIGYYLDWIESIAWP